MTIKEMIEEETREILFNTDDFAEPAIYYISGVPTPITVVKELKEDTKEGGGIVEGICFLFVMVEEVAQPVYHDRVILTMPDLTTENYYMQKNLESNGFYWKLLMIREETPKL